jgi:peptide/nickel transport system substrate-binding protein
MSRHLAHKALCLLLLIGSISPVLAKGFRYPESSKPSSLMPFFVENMSAIRISEFIFEPLTAKNKRGNIEGVLAIGWQVAPDSRSITFQLRPNVKWHDNRPFVAEDVVFTVNAAKNPKTIFNGKGRFRFIETVQAISPTQVKFTFIQPKKKPEELFNFKIIPKHAFRSTTISRLDRFSRKPIGTGPYKVASSQLRNTKLVKHKQYWGQASINNVEMMHLPDSNEQINLLKYSGEGAGVQSVIFIPPRNMSIFENSDTVILEPYHTVSWWYMAFNHKSKALKDLSVRQAIALALDREELLEAHLGQGDILSGPFTESSPYYNFDVEAREQDLDEARSILEKAGYRMKRGVRTKGSQKLKLKFVLNKDLSNCQPLALSIQAQLKQIGVIVTPVFVDNSLYQEKVINRKKFDLTMNIWSFNEIEDIYPLFRTGQRTNYINYSNPEVDAKLDASRNPNQDYKVHKEIMKEVHTLLHEDLPYVFLWSLDVYSGLSRQLKNIYIQPYYYFTFFKSWSFK